ncbi:MAG: DinB family protein [Bacteroidota bacterium]
MKSFDLDKTIEILARTPAVLEQWLAGLSDSWLLVNEGPDTWSPFDVVGHLIHGEKTDWIPRAKHILAGNPTPFPAFDRFAQFEESKGKTIDDLLASFKALRHTNIRHLVAMHLAPADLQRTGIHPDFGEVTLQQLLATWVAHDLSHIRQIARVMAKQYSNEIGPWRAYLPVIEE